MAGDWSTVELGDIVDIYDGPHATPEKTDSGPIFLGISNLNRGRLDLSAVERLSEEDFLRWTRRITPSPGDIVFSYETRLGEAAIIPEGLKCCLGRRMGLLRVKSRNIESRFLLYAYLGPEFQNTLRARTIHGSTVDRIPLIEMGGFSIPVPDPSTQRAIAHILGTLDDKIELNRRMNATLEGMARALFKSWFVDFDPVRAKAEGRDTGLPPDLAALFPDRLVESELGEVPEGWGVGTFGQVAQNMRRTVQPSELEPETPYIGLQHMPRRSIALSEWGIGDELESNKYEFREGEILFGKLRPYFHKVGVAPIDGVCSTDIVVLSPVAPEWFGPVLGYASSDAFVEFTNASSTGTKMPRTGWQDMARYPMVIPPISLAGTLAGYVRPLVERIQTNIHESRTLAALRDTLLPKLLSGEVRAACYADLQ
jgi:type I restriction enzyme S subunit